MALEVAAGFHPVAAALARIYQVAYPPKFEQSLTGWRQQISATANDQEARLTALKRERPPLVVSDDALSVASWLSLTSQTGLGDPIEREALAQAFPQASARKLQDAAELEMHDLARVSKALGQRLLLISPTYALFAVFDPAVIGTSPQSDAAATARTALQLDSGHAPVLDAHLGWPRRRFNPAFALLLDLVEDGRIRQPIQRDYPRLGFIMAAEERVRFKALIQAAAPAYPVQGRIEAARLIRALNTVDSYPTTPRRPKRWHPCWSDQPAQA